MECSVDAAWRGARPGARIRRRKRIARLLATLLLPVQALAQAGPPSHSVCVGDAAGLVAAFREAQARYPDDFEIRVQRGRYLIDQPLHAGSGSHREERTHFALRGGYQDIDCQQERDPRFDPGTTLVLAGGPLDLWDTHGTFEVRVRELRIEAGGLRASATFAVLIERVRVEGESRLWVQSGSVTVEDSSVRGAIGSLTAEHFEALWRPQ